MNCWSMETLRTIPTPVERRLSVIKRQLELGNWRKAEQMCLKILRGGSPDAVYLLGIVHMKAGRPSEALTWLRKAVDLEPANAVKRFALAGALQSLERTQESAEAWLAGIEIDPGHVFAHIGLADA